MSQLQEIYQKRETLYHDLTAALLAELSVAIEAATSLVDNDVVNQLKWKNVALLDDKVYVTGEVEFPLGHILTTSDGAEVTVDPELQAQLRRVVRIGIPLELAETGTFDQIVDYLKELQKQAPPEFPTVFDAENRSIETAVDLAGEFRSAGLSKDQISSMIVFAEQSKGKVN